MVRPIPAHLRVIFSILFIHAALVNLSVFNVFADTVILKSGKEYIGTIADITEKSIVLERDGLTTTFYMDEIERFQRTGRTQVSLPQAAQKISYNVRKVFLFRSQIELLTLQFTFPLSRIDIPGQTMANIIAEPTASALIDRPDGNKVSIFHFSNVKPGEERKIMISYNVTIDPEKEKKDLLSGSSALALPESQLKLYLSVEKSLRDRKDLNDVVQAATKEKALLKDKAKAIYDYIADNFIYQNTKGLSGSQSVHMTLFNKTGNCVDLSRLFITLARLSGIPTRQVLGIVFQPQDDPRRYIADSGHAWAEVYLPKEGWIAVDATFGIGAKEKFFDFPYQIHIREIYEENISQGPGSLYRGSSIEASSMSQFSAGSVEQRASYEMELAIPDP